MTSYALRLPDHVMEQAKAAAAEDNISINQLFVSFIAEGLGHRRGLQALKERAARANIDAALATLDKVPAVQPDPGDEIPDMKDHGSALRPSR
jgi:hypothetical protein